MPDHDPNAESAKRTLSEISHLFLSDVRDRHTGGAPRPQRVPPGQKPAVEPDIPAANTNAIPEPHQHLPGAANNAIVDSETAPTPPITAVIAAHFGGEQPARVRQYAEHLAARIGRVGLIEVDGCEVRIACFEPDGDAVGLHFDDAPFPQSEVNDARSLAEAIEELDWDVRHWLLAPSNLRCAETRLLMGSVRHWALLSTCDHDGVVSSYRALKGLCDIVDGRKPLLTLSLLDAGSEPEMVRVFGKLAGVCQQFLDWPVEPEPAVRPAPDVTEDPVLVFRPDQPEGAGPWKVLADLAARANGSESMVDDANIFSKRAVGRTSVEERDGPATPPVRHAPAQEEFVMNEQPRPTPAPTANSSSNEHRSTGDPVIAAEVTTSRTGTSEVLEISSDGTADSILAAILSRPESGLVECPVRTPMCPSARLTIDRDRRLILMAVAREGLAELRSIGQAYRWLIENRALIGMAVPQLAIDAHQFPRLRLLIDHADASADVLQPMLQSGHVTVQAYRRLRWGDRTGLLLDAA